MSIGLWKSLRAYVRERERSVCKREDQTATAYVQITPGRARSELPDQWKSREQEHESVRGGALLIFFLFPGTIPQMPPSALEAIQMQAALSFINNWPRGTWFFCADTNQGSLYGTPLHSLPVVRSIPCWSTSEIAYLILAKLTLRKWTHNFKVSCKEIAVGSQTPRKWPSGQEPTTGTSSPQSATLPGGTVVTCSF